MLLQNDVPLAAMEQQLRAGIAWSKLVGRRLRPRGITIGEDEIDEALERIKADRDKPNTGWPRFSTVSGLKRKKMFAAPLKGFAGKYKTALISRRSRANFLKARRPQWEGIWAGFTKRN